MLVALCLWLVCTHVHLFTCTYITCCTFNKWHFSKYIFVFPRFFRVSCNKHCGRHLFLSCIFHSFSFTCRLHFKIVYFSLLN
ncbi:hypothetical protein YC2023_038245 [Brassica napus]